MTSFWSGTQHAALFQRDITELPRSTRGHASKRIGGVITDADPQAGKSENKSLKLQVAEAVLQIMRATLNH